MSRLCVLICRIEDEQQPDKLTELHRVELPGVSLEELRPDSTLDTLEGRSLGAGHEVMRHLLRQEWQEVDRLLVERHQQLSPPGSSGQRRR
jgi:hypothetical protein